MNRTLSLYDLASLAHREMTRVSPKAALAEVDADEELESILAEEQSGTAQLFFARLDRIEEQQRTHESYLKAILKAVT